MRRSQRLRVFALGLTAVVLIAATSWLAWGALGVARGALDFRSSASALAVDPEGLTSDRFAVAVQDLARTSPPFSAATSTPSWKVIEGLPWVGQSAQGVTRVSARLGVAVSSLEALTITAPEPPIGLDEFSALDDTRDLAEAAADSLNDLGEALFDLAGQPLLRPLASSLRESAESTRALATRLSQQPGG